MDVEKPGPGRIRLSEAAHPGSARVSPIVFGIDFAVLSAKHKNGGRSSRDAGGGRHLWRNNEFGAHWRTLIEHPSPAPSVAGAPPSIFPLREDNTA